MWVDGISKFEFGFDFDPDFGFDIRTPDHQRWIVRVFHACLELAPALV
jgi:hypothetical protein